MITANTTSSSISSARPVGWPEFNLRTTITISSSSLSKERFPSRCSSPRLDPALVKIEMGLYWITKGGGEPFEYFEANPGRFVMFHVKGMDATPRRHTEVGRDSIHFERIFSRAEQAGAKHFFVEQDESPASPLDSARAGLEYLRALGL